MSQRGLIFILLAVTLIISLTLGCGSETPLAVTPDPYQEIINTAIKDFQSGSLQGANQVEHDLTELLREQGGARAAFGDQADAIFQQIDQAKAAITEDLLNQAKGLSGYAPNESQMNSAIGKSGTTRGSPLTINNYQSLPLAGVLVSLSGVCLEAQNEPRDENGNATVLREEETTDGKDTRRMSMQLKLMGSRMEVEVEITVAIPEPLAYEERCIGKLSVELCPDAQGNVPLQFSFHNGIALNGGGQQLGSEGQAIGHVSDEGKLASYELQSTSSGARQPIKGIGDDWGATNRYFEYTLNVTSSATNPNDSRSSSAFTRVSSEVDQKFVDQATPVLAMLNNVMPFLGFMAASRHWENGYCVAVQVPEMGAGEEKTVQVNSETPFTAKVRHKFENAELRVPVIATLADGQVSVSPSGSKVPAPAAFTYKAPDQNGRTATVNLETRSKRGIGKLDVKFKTGRQGYKVDGPFGETHIFGKICSGLDVPFTLNWDTQVGLAGTITFSPSTGNGGTWSLEGSAFGNYVTNAGAGNYTIESSAGMTPSSIVIQDGTISQTTVGFGTIENAIGSPIAILLEPAGEECSP